MLFHRLTCADRIGLNLEEVVYRLLACTGGGTACVRQDVEFERVYPPQQWRFIDGYASVAPKRQSVSKTLQILGVDWSWKKSLKCRIALHEDVGFSQADHFVVFLNERLDLSENFAVIAQAMKRDQPVVA
ncbi:hypothetical protein [Bradyrhizobium japonicum]|uniref:hypothetical protein n=1 Tax=Bradyrhizobium japonicum TaxID=375 RepID=UPI001FCB922A|nr:hypothetical protein [Bradyrhizobium japonicum]